MSSVGAHAMAGSLTIGRNDERLSSRGFEPLASCREGCTEAILAAHGFTVERIVSRGEEGYTNADLRAAHEILHG